jgi:hypothetical protein
MTAEDGGRARLALSVILGLVPRIQALVAWVRDKAGVAASSHDGERRMSRE